jgi:hypothetical protein
VIWLLTFKVIPMTVVFGIAWILRIVSWLICPPQIDKWIWDRPWACKLEMHTYGPYNQNYTAICKRCGMPHYDPPDIMP